jgi:hypothetical protein
VSRQVKWDPALVSVVPVVSEVDDGWRLRRDAVIQVAVFTAGVDGYLIWGRRRMRVWIED